MATLNCDAYPNSLVLSMEDSFIIGTVDQIQKLHVRTIPLMETPRRLAHQVSTHTFAVITVRQTSTKHWWVGCDVTSCIVRNTLPVKEVVSGSVVSVSLPFGSCGCVTCFGSCGCGTSFW